MFNLPSIHVVDLHRRDRNWRLKAEYLAVEIQTQVRYSPLQDKKHDLLGHSNGTPPPMPQNRQDSPLLDG